MSIQPDLGVHGRIRTAVAGITMLQIQRKEVGLLFNATDDTERFAKIRLRIGWVGGSMAQTSFENRAF